MIFMSTLLSLGVQLSSFNCWEILRSGSQQQIKSGNPSQAKLPEFLPRAIYEMENASVADNLEIQQRLFEKYGSGFGDP